MSRDEEFQPRPGRMRTKPSPRAKPFISQALIAAQKAGGVAGRSGPGKGGGSFGRGRAATLRAGRGLDGRARNVMIKTTIVRHGRTRVPVSAHLEYLQRDGVTREGQPARAFDAAGDETDGRAFAARCRDDRHHFRFILGPEDAAELENLKVFTRDLMATAERDLGTTLDWVAVDHWNTEYPHVHVLVRGVADDGRDLVIAPDYLNEGLRARGRERATLELGPRTELEIRRGLEREQDAERWTRLDRSLARDAAEADGVLDLRPPLMGRPDPLHSVRIGRARKLEQLGLAEPLGPARWRLSPDLEPTLRELGRRGDIIQRLHRAMSDQGFERAASDLVLDGGAGTAPVIGRLAARGLDDELRGTAYVVIDGLDGRAHHVSLPSLEAAGDSGVGSIVEARWTEPVEGRRPRLVIATRSDLDLAHQLEADGATWLDRQLVGRSPAPLAERGFGQEVKDALEQRRERLIERGWAERGADGGVTFRPGTLNALRQRELDAAARRIADETGLNHQPLAEGETVAGAVRRRLTLASGRFAMIDDGLGFSLVPWRDDLGRELGKQVSGISLPGGGVDWSFGRKRDLGL